jgi:hypothetical protein
MRKPDHKTAVTVLPVVGPLLYDNTGDWQAMMSHDLNVPRDTIREWQRPGSALRPGHRALDDLLKIAERRAEETARARDLLRAWVEGNPSI